MAKILILIGAHLCTAPRPQKEAATLAAAGHEVIVRGVWFNPELVERDCLLIKDQPWRFKPALDFRPQNRLTHFLVRFQARLARAGFRYFQWFSPALLGYGTRAMLRAALQEQADLTIVHSEAGLWVGQQLLVRGFQVGVDFEDWFSEDLLPQAKITRPIVQLKQLEAVLAQRCTYSLAPSQAFASQISQAYDAPKPTVIYNVFPQSETRSHAPATLSCDTALPSLHWFSQTIGKGRGLETLFQALPLLTYPVAVHLRGNCSEQTRAWINALVPTLHQSQIFIHPIVSNHELPARIAEYDIGLALETPYCANKEYTISNKLFQYMQAGLAVIATNTVGQAEILQQCPEAGCLVPPDNPQALARVINQFIANPQALLTAKQGALLAAKTQFTWENQSDRLVKTALLALSHN